MRKLKKSEKTMIMRLGVIFVAIVLVILFVILFNRTAILESFQYSVTSDERAYIFKKQSYVTLETSSPVEFSVKSGEKVASASVLTNSLKVSTAKYANQMLQAVNYILSKDKFSSVEEFLILMQEKQNDVFSLQARLESAQSEEERNTLTKQLASSAEEYEIMQIAVRFVFSDEDYLKSLKKTYTKLAASTDEVSLTVGNLNFPYTGYVYYDLSGYENVLNASLISSVDMEYFDYLSSFRPKAQSSSSKTLYVRVINSSYMYIVFMTDSDTYFKAEKAMTDMRAKILLDYEYDNSADYYALLQRRNDVLLSFPQIEFKDSEGISHKGHCVNSIVEGKNKIVVIMLKGNVSGLMDKNIEDISIVAEDYQAYTLPLSAIVYRGEGELKKAYVLSREKEGLYKYVPVIVYKEDGGKAVLRTSDNSELENLEVLLHPKFRFWKKVGQ